MQVSVVFAILASAMVCSAQFLPPPVVPGGIIPPPIAPLIPPIIPPFLLPGLGFRPFFGLRRFGMFGGLGFPFGFGFGGLGLPLLGKRDTEAVENMDKEKKGTEEIAEKIAEKINEIDNPKVENKIVEKSVEQKMVVKSVENKVVEKSIVEPRTLCSLSTEDNVLKCKGVNVTIDCIVKPHISKLGDIKLKIADLIFKKSSEDVIELVTRDSEITAVSPIDKKNILISLFKGEKKDLIGFEVEKHECWEKLEKLVSETTPENMRVSLFVQA